MISKSQVKQIQQLSQKKFRDETGLFVAEGFKLVTELTGHFEPVYLACTAPRWKEFTDLTGLEVNVVSAEEMDKISFQKTSQGVLAVLKKRIDTFPDNIFENQLCLALDDIQDPGNLGTIIRIADWFGIHNIFCSMHCADAFGPKTVQSTMGALARVKIHTVDLDVFLSSINHETPVYGTFMDGNNIYSEQLSANGIIVMGNEGNGISDKIEKLVSKRLLIPSFPPSSPTSESLNVAVATALICAEFRRREGGDNS